MSLGILACKKFWASSIFPGTWPKLGMTSNLWSKSFLSFRCQDRLASTAPDSSSQITLTLNSSSPSLRAALFIMPSHSSFVPSTYAFSPKLRPRRILFLNSLSVPRKRSFMLSIKLVFPNPFRPEINVIFFPFLGGEKAKVWVPL